MSNDTNSNDEMVSKDSNEKLNGNNENEGCLTGHFIKITGPKISISLLNKIKKIVVEEGCVVNTVQFPELIDKDIHRDENEVNYSHENTLVASDIADIQANADVNSTGIVKKEKVPAAASESVLMLDDTRSFLGNFHEPTVIENTLQSIKVKPESADDEKTGTEKEDAVLEESAKESNKYVVSDASKKQSGVDKQKTGDVSDNEQCKNLWVSNIGSSTKAADLKKLLSNHGKVINAKIVTDGFKCYGYVVMASVEEAEACINRCNNYKFNDTILCVSTKEPERLKPAKQLPFESDKRSKKASSADESKRTETEKRKRLADEEKREAERLLAKKRRLEDEARVLREERANLRRNEIVYRDEQKRLSRERDKLRAEKQRFEQEKISLERERQRKKREKLEADMAELKRRRLELVNKKQYKEFQVRQKGSRTSETDTRSRDDNRNKTTDTNKKNDHGLFKTPIYNQQRRSDNRDVDYVVSSKKPKSSTDVQAKPYDFQRKSSKNASPENWGAYGPSVHSSPSWKRTSSPATGGPSKNYSPKREWANNGVGNHGWIPELMTLAPPHIAGWNSGARPGYTNSNSGMSCPQSPAGNNYSGRYESSHNARKY